MFRNISDFTLIQLDLTDFGFTHSSHNFILCVLWEREVNIQKPFFLLVSVFILFNIIYINAASGMIFPDVTSSHGHCLHSSFYNRDI